MFVILFHFKEKGKLLSVEGRDELLDINNQDKLCSIEEAFVLGVLNAKESIVFVLLFGAKESSRSLSSSSTSKSSSSFSALTTIRRTTSPQR